MSKDNTIEAELHFISKLIGDFFDNHQVDFSIPLEEIKKDELMGMLLSHVHFLFLLDGLSHHIYKKYTEAKEYFNKCDPTHMNKLHADFILNHLEYLSKTLNQEGDIK